MPCMDSSGELTEMARKMLRAMTSPTPLDEVAAKTGIPLYRLRSAARELVDAGLLIEQGGTYALTDAGGAALSKSAGKA